MNYKIGVLGDDAKTEFILVNTEGKIRGQTTAIACNPSFLSYANAKDRSDGPA